MTFQALLATLAASGIQLRGAGEEIVVTGNEKALDAELIRNEELDLLLSPQS